ncbi:putative disease resistance protein RGA3 [Momordica charantia]|uniref:Disease resistance protein RGA3 n=1 Tax=Momordica charantia TaxID=3673 RepID=A0A6J1DMC1_MOMCH|nr:putative disease resistance protein RGA3 [Momordica charantia]XP_022154697.1 putative disease resistance protein RGA3 [Momordica charantia]
MAQSILFNVAGSLIMKLGSLAFRELALLWGVDDELEKLKDAVSAIKAVLLDAEEQQYKSHAVKNWVSRLKDVLYDVDDLIDEFSYETLRRQVKAKDGRKPEQVCMFFSKSNPVAFGFRMGQTIKDIREKLNGINADKTQFHFSERTMDTPDDGLRKGRETYSFIPEGEVIGRDDDRKAIADLLLDTNFKEDIAVIAIVGMGGLGKTTLAQSVYNDEMIRKHFALKLWVCVSEEFDVKIIVEKILESATMKRHGPFEIDTLQSLLRKEIDGKKYLFVMDDVWNENYEKWVHLKRLLMCGATGSRILITTRSIQVAKTFDVVSLYPLENLNEDDSWLLFKKMASLKGAEEELGNSNLFKIGKEIVAKLKGVPLAIRTIWRLLCSKKSEADWLFFKNNELSRAVRQENEMQSILKISYNHLSSNLKQCFAYCALFPKNYEIRKDEVIKQWVAQGFIQPQSIKAIEDVGEDYFMELLWRSFFQDIRSNELGDIKQFKMHDLMHDLACSIDENECVLASLNARSIVKRTRHVLFEFKLNETWELPESLIEAKNLTTLYNPPFDRKKPLHKMFSNHLRLRTLVLVYSFIIELPKSTSKLKHLRYLDLSCNNYIEFLPNSITELYNLETLLLCGCTGSRTLPRDTKNLISLRHLDMCDCYALTHMPKGLGEMTSLQTMNLFVLGDTNSNGLSELNGLGNLKGSLTIRDLQFQTIGDLQKNAYYLKLKSGIKRLMLHWKDGRGKKSKIVALDDEERVLECLEPHPNLQKIEILGYHGARLCNWLSSDSLVRLVTIKLSHCSRLQQLPQFDQYPFLKHLCLESLICIEYIDNNSNIYLSSSTFFPSLEKLEISTMPNLKGWWKGETSGELAQNSVSFPTMMPCLST